MTTAHGAFIQEPVCRRNKRAPFDENLSTKPSPGPFTDSPAPCFAKVTKMLPPMFSMLKGANPAGMVGSWNAPAGRGNPAEVGSKTSTPPPAKITAYQKVPPPPLPIL